MKIINTLKVRTMAPSAMTHLSQHRIYYTYLINMYMKFGKIKAVFQERIWVSLDIEDAKRLTLLGLVEVNYSICFQIKGGNNPTALLWLKWTSCNSGVIPEH